MISPFGLARSRPIPSRPRFVLQTGRRHPILPDQRGNDKTRRALGPSETICNPLAIVPGRTQPPSSQNAGIASTPPRPLLGSTKVAKIVVGGVVSVASADAAIPFKLTLSSG
jgi:hypothetical protein